MGFSNTDIKSTNPRPIIISDAIKKGKSAGSTISNHMLRPFKAASKERRGNNSIRMTIPNAGQAINPILSLFNFRDSIGYSSKFMILQFS